jgi:hypothetical protein
MALLLFALYSILSGGQQGIITWLFREYVPESRKDWVHAALHYGGVIIYLVLVAYVVYQLQQPWWVLLIDAALARALRPEPERVTVLVQLPGGEACRVPVQGRYHCRRR